MVNLMDTEVFASDSQSPSASSDHSEFRDYDLCTFPFFFLAD